MVPSSLADIARLTGFAVSTVSRALRNSAEIPRATQQKIKEAARKLNYRPNPILASLARTRFASRPNDGIPLAYLHFAVEPDNEPVVQDIIRANQAHARKLGYRLDPFLITDFKDGAQATRILFSRGIQGIFLPATFHFDMLTGMDWSRFSLAGCGEIVVDPLNPLSALANYATVDYFRSLLNCWSEVRKKGYRRIGFVLLHVLTIDDQTRWGAIQACIRDISPRHRLPPLILKLKSGVYDTAELGPWVRRHRPDAIIGFNNFIGWNLNQQGFRIPEDIAFASLHKTVSHGMRSVKDDSDSGMKDMRLEVMFAAIELLDQQIRHREFGLLPTSRIQVIQSPWIEGNSLPLAKPQSKRLKKIAQLAD